MTHDDARESLSAFLDEALAPDERQRVAQHLEDASGGSHEDRHRRKSGSQGHDQ